MGEGKDYFNQALSDFMFEAASGGAIRHLTDMGYSVDQILGKLSFPTPRERVEKTVYRHMRETGLLLSELSVRETDFHVSVLEARYADQISARFLKLLEQNGERSAYLECTYGSLQRREPARWEALLSCLNSREREYLCGVRWERDVMYHRLNSRMREIAVKLALVGKTQQRCFFLERREMLVVYGSLEE